LATFHINTQSFNENFNALQDQTIKPKQRGKGTIQPYTRATMIGAVAGLRSMMPLALLAWNENSAQKKPGLLSHLLDIPIVKVATGLASIGEVIADKTPLIPSRLSEGSFMARLASGALAGMFITSQARCSPALGAVLGAAGAGLGSVTGYCFRTVLPATTHVSDFIWAVVEDICAFSLGSYVIDPGHTG
jgi:uncharacterized membrane protein